MFQVPILVLAFNRADTTQKVFDNIKLLKPKYLFVGVDGPRHDRPSELKKCQDVQNIFLNQIDWECQLKTLFRTQNLGCRDAVNEAITWFFNHVEEGIILEDDCIPNQSFFNFCSVLLKEYRNDSSIMHISGYKPHGMKIDLPYSYLYSKQAIVWGWATWARAWSEMDVDMRAFPLYKEEKGIKQYIDDTCIQTYMLDKWEETYSKMNSSWAYAWSFCIENLNGITIVANQNLIQNIGYGEEATNTKTDHLNRASNYSDIMEFPLIHPISYNDFTTNEKEKIEKEIFYKIQKSKIGLFIRKLVPRPVLEFARRILGMKN